MLNDRGLKLYTYHQLCHAQLRFLHSAKKAQRFRGIHGGETIYCVGAGPSLLLENVSCLNGQILFFVNRSFELLDRVKPKVGYWMVQDSKALATYKDVDRFLFNASFRTIHDFSHSLRRPPFSREDVVLLPKFYYSNKLWPIIQPPGPNFSEDIASWIGMTPTVMFSAIQIAAYMGASHIALLGFDLSYNGVQNHFYDEPFAQKNAFFGSYESTFLPVLSKYHAILNSKQTRLLNCSRTTRDDVLPKRALKDVIRGRV